MIDDYAHAERLAICAESGVPYSIAKRIADAQVAKPTLSNVERLNAHRLKVAEDKLAKRNYTERY